MGVVRGYFDGAGDRAGAMAQTVGGFVAPSSNWRKLTRDWAAVLEAEDVAVFHMTDFIAARGEFASWKGDGARSQRFLRSLVKVIRRHVHFAAASTVMLDDWSRLKERYAMKECHVSPFGLASFSVIGKCILWSGKNRPADAFVPVFERGDADRGDRDHLLAWVRKLGGPILDGVKVQEESKNSPPLQAADLAVWSHRIAVTERFSRSFSELSACMRELLMLDHSYGVIQRAQLDEHRARLGVPARIRWSTWSQKQKARWRPRAFSSGTLYPVDEHVAD